ncbi:MAG TPA: 50S ribosome-binding GTPase, partial [Parvularculaceae bacterium]|nr:50S ribosome-binding GTPase [Parvularculaceae bacterium]
MQDDIPATTPLRAAPLKIAIVGRPNVGKSTLFNRLVGKRLAIVDDTPGVTSDRREGEARLGGVSFIAIDTPGIEEAPEAALQGRMRLQTEKAIDEAAATIFVIDARVGVTPLDQRFAQLLRERGKPVILAANKAESAAAEAGLLDAWSLALGEPIAIAAEHGIGLGELQQAIEEAIETTQRDSDHEIDEEIAWDDPLKPLR